MLDSSLFTRLDGLGVFIFGYNRALTVSNSTFEWIGGSAMASWGDTSYALNANGSRTIPWCASHLILYHYGGTWYSNLWSDMYTACSRV